MGMKVKHPLLTQATIEALREKKKADNRTWTSIAAQLDVSEDLLNKMMLKTRGVNESAKYGIAALLEIPSDTICVSN